MVTARGAYITPINESKTIKVGKTMYLSRYRLNAQPGTRMSDFKVLPIGKNKSQSTTQVYWII
jgi:hypothetical protein